jgi:hypothetical protein
MHRKNVLRDRQIASYAKMQIRTKPKISGLCISIVASY